MIDLSQNKIPVIGGLIPVLKASGEIVFKFRTRGTCFPARADGYTSRSSFFQVRSFDNVDNKVLIDYSDGTGWHEYTFGQNANRREKIFRVNDSTDPNQIAHSPATIYVGANDGLGGGEFGIHFYQDLQDAAKIDTVDHFYSQERDIFIKFQDPAKIKTIGFQNVVLLEAFPSLARLRNLEIMELEYLLTLTGFENAAVSTLMKIVSLSGIGITSPTVPLWIKNSPITYLNLSEYITLTDATDLENEIITPFKDSLILLYLNRCNLNYQLPESFAEIASLVTFSIASLSEAENFVSPVNLANMIEFQNLIISDSNNFPIEQVKRFIQEVPTTDKTINARRLGVTTDTAKDMVLDNDDHSVKEFNASYGKWNNGLPPTAIGQMKALEELTIYGSYNYSVDSGAFNLLGWGDFSGATALKEINFKWQQKMDLNFPTWLVNLTELKIFDCHASFETQAKMDDFVNSVYAFVVANASAVAGNSPFRQMNIITYNSSSPLNSFTPTGTYQEPTGEPTTPMEQLWVLTNDYEHIWTIKPN